MKNKKYYYELSWTNIVTAIVLGIFTFYSISNLKDSFWIGISSALILTALSGALNGAAFGGLTSALAFLGAIIYKVNYKAAPSFKASKKAIETLGKAAAEEQAALKLEAFNSSIANLDKYKFLLFISAIVLAFVGRYIYLKVKCTTANEERVQKNYFSARTLSYLAMFVALSVVLNTLRVGPISFGGFPIIYGGLALGPVYGFIIGLVSDLLGFLVRPSGNGFNLAFTLTSALTGAIPVLVLRIFGNDPKNKHSFVKVLIGIFVGQTLTSVIMVPYFMKLFYGFNFWERVLKAFSKQVWSIPLYAFIFVSTWKVVNRQVDFKSIEKTDFAIPQK